MENKKIEELKIITNYNKDVLDWIDDNIEKVESTQLIMNEKYMTTEYTDEIKTEMIRRIADQLLEHAANFKKTKAGYTLSMSFIKRLTKKRKEKK
jgi:galactose-1-phosphate uridylyltransferase